VVDLLIRSWPQSQPMIAVLLSLLRSLPFLFGGHRQLALENLALRQQLAVYKRMVSRPRLRTTDRLLWVGLARVWAGWRQALVIMSPDTVLRWPRRRFREHWMRLSSRPRLGRPPIGAQTTALIRKMAATNPLWGAPRIHGELLKLGIEVAERTVSRLMPKRRPPSSQTWRTFLANHVPDLASIDFLHRTNRGFAGALRPRCARPPSPAHRPLQRDRASNGELDGPADRGRIPGRLHAVLFPARP